MMLKLVLIPFLFLVGCSSNSATDKKDEIIDPFDEGYFAFSTPKALQAQETSKKFINANRYGKKIA